MHEPTTFDQTMGKTVEHESANNPCRGMRVLDGGLATELEFLGADLSGPLWSAHVLERQPGFTRLFLGQVQRSSADAEADREILTNQPDGEYAATAWEDCSIYRWMGKAGTGDGKP